MSRQNAPITYIWQDRRRICGLPLSFTRYRMSEDRLFLMKGFFNLHMDEVLLYRVPGYHANPFLWTAPVWHGNCHCLLFGQNPARIPAEEHPPLPVGERAHSRTSGRNENAAPYAH